MTLPVPELDDRRFQDIVDEAKRKIPELCPDWTNHNVSDPGIALIELFAWMTEMTLYRVNQVPERLYTKFLELMGIELFPASPARADLTFWLTALETDAVVVPAGTEVSSSDTQGGSPVIFMTDTDLRIAQPRLVAALTYAGTDRYADCWEDLKYGRVAVTCFPSRPLRPDDCFYLGFARSIAGSVLRLDFNADDIQGVGVKPLQPPLQWETWCGEEWVPATVLRDETGGLNRDGPLVLMIPREELPLTIGERTGHWIRVRLLRPGPDQPSFTTSPRVFGVRASVLGGSVPSHHAHTAPAEHLGRSDGTPGQRFQLRFRPVLDREPAETVRILTSQGAEAWVEVVDFARSGPDDKHYTCDPTTGEIRFGPQIRYPGRVTRQHGAIPPTGAEVAFTTYRYGGGAAGNVAAGTLTVLRTTIPYIDHVENLSAADGGVDAEAIENAKLRGPIALRTGERAVTASDYEYLMLEAAPGIVRARCLAPAREGGPVRLLVVPRVLRPANELELDDFALSDALVDDIRRHLDERRVLGTSIEIGTPYYQGVTVAALVKALPGRSPDAVKQRVLDALYGLVNPVTGGTTGDGWGFDTDLNAGNVAQLLAEIEGVERVGEVVFFEADLRNRRRHGQARELVRLDEHSLFLSFNHRVVVR